MEHVIKLACAPSARRPPAAQQTTCTPSQVAQPLIHRLTGRMEYAYSLSSMRASTGASGCVRADSCSRTICSRGAVIR